MAEVDEKAVLSGVLRGVELAVAGDLSSLDEVLSEEHTIDELIADALAVARRVVEDAPPGQMQHFRQVIAGEVAGMTVAARTWEGDRSDLTDSDVKEILVIMFGKIDRWVYRP